MSARWFELDIGWCYIRLLQALGLARVRTAVPRPPTGKRRLPLSERTVAGVGVYRHHIMRSFGVMAVRALREELRSGPGLDPRSRRRAERLLRREPAYLSDAEKHVLAVLAGQHEWLAHVQRMREELSRLWEWKLAPPQELLAYLVDWCDRADQSGIRVLRKVARELHAYG